MSSPSSAQSVVLDAKENREKKKVAASYFFLALFFRVTHDGLRERGATRNLFLKVCIPAKWPIRPKLIPVSVT